MAIKDPYSGALGQLAEQYSMKPSYDNEMEAKTNEQLMREIGEKTKKEIDSLDQNDPNFDQKLKDIQDRHKEQLLQFKIITPRGKVNPGTKQLIDLDKLASNEKPMMMAKADPMGMALKDVMDRSEDPGLAALGEPEAMDESGNWNWENRAAFDQMKKDFKVDQERRKKLNKK